VELIGYLGTTSVLSARVVSLRRVIERWSRDQVLALAPDTASHKAAQGVSAPGKWSGAGVLDDVVWGECKGSGSTPYRACVDLSEPAYRCSCPSRKFPCKHALGVLLLWSSDGVAAAEAHPDWVAEWLAQRRDRAAKQAAKVEAARERAERTDQGSPDGATRAADADRRTAQRAERVTAGLSELERWLADQVGQGVAGARRSGPADWDDLAKRLVDAQAPGVAGAVGRFHRVLGEEDWPGRLLEEYAMAHLLAVAHRRSGDLPEGLRETVRSRIGFPVTRESVLASEPVRDRWDVIGSRDEEQDRLLARRVWLRGRSTGRPALVLSFAPVGQALDASLVVGTTIDADLAFYPGAVPLRALVAERHGPGLPAHVAPAAQESPGAPSQEPTAAPRQATAPGQEPTAAPGHASAAATGYPSTTCFGHASAAASGHATAGGTGPPPGVGIAELSVQIADALAGDPWTQSWPAVLAGVIPVRDRGWLLADADADIANDAGADSDTGALATTVTGTRALATTTTTTETETDSDADATGGIAIDGGGLGGARGAVEALPLHASAGTPWSLLAVSGGHPVTVAVEWTPQGLRPLTIWDEEGQVVLL
jgi:hypothetical protein